MKTRITVFEFVGLFGFNSLVIVMADFAGVNSEKTVTIVAPPMFLMAYELHSVRKGKPSIWGYIRKTSRDRFIFIVCMFLILIPSAYFQVPSFSVSTRLLGYVVGLGCGVVGFLLIGRNETKQLLLNRYCVGSKDKL